MSYSRFGVPGAQLRRAIFPVAADEFTTVAALTDCVIRPAIMTADPTTRWRLRIRINNSAGTSANFTGVFVGDPAYDSQGTNAGAFASTPTLALSTIGTVNGNTDVVTGWVTDPAVQFGPTPRLLSIGATMTAATPCFQSRMSANMWGTVTTSSTALSSQAGSTTVTGGTYFSRDVNFNIRLEYETLTSRPVVLFIGDSITSGWLDAENTPQLPLRGPMASWVQRVAAKDRIHPIIAGLGGAVWSDFSTSTSPTFVRLGLGVDTFADAVVFAIGVNEAQNNSLSSYLTGLRTTMSAISGFITPGVLPRYINCTAVPQPRYKVGRMAASAASGVTTISTTVAYANGDVIDIGSGLSTAETRTVSGASTGSGPFTTTLTAATSAAHAIGESVCLSRETIRRSINTAILTHVGPVHRVMLVGEALGMTDDEFRADDRWFTNSSIHPTPNGYAKIAASVSTGL